MREKNITYNLWDRVIVYQSNSIPKIIRVNIKNDEKIKNPFTIFLIVVLLDVTSFIEMVQKIFKNNIPC